MTLVNQGLPDTGCPGVPGEKGDGQLSFSISHSVCIDTVLHCIWQ